MSPHLTSLAALIPLAWSLMPNSASGAEPAPARPAAAVAETLAPAPAVYVFKYWYPGYLPGRFGRAVLVLEVGKKDVRLRATVETPTDGPGNPNPRAWTTDPEKAVLLTGSVQPRKDGATYWFQAALPKSLALVCRRSSAPVHARGATVETGACSPCYDDGCPDRPVWSPKTVRTRSGLDCVLYEAAEVGTDGVAKSTDATVVRDLQGLGNTQFVPDDGHLFFAPAPGVEHLVGNTDCPPHGLRETEWR